MTTSEAWTCSRADCTEPGPHEHERIALDGALTPFSLTRRRAVFVYEAARKAAIAAHAPVIPAPWSHRELPFVEQFCKVIEKQCGPDRSDSPSDLHEEWVTAYATMGWTLGEVYDPIAKKHPDMVPYEHLTELEQDKDSVFVALCEIARLWIRS